MSEEKPSDLTSDDAPERASSSPAKAPGSDPATAAPRVPDSIEGFFVQRVLARLRGGTIAVVLAASALLLVWQTVPDEDKSRLIAASVMMMHGEDAAAPNIMVSHFEVDAEADKDAQWLRVKLERKLVEKFSGAGHNVAHDLVEAQGSDRPELLLTGRIAERGGRYQIAATLKEKQRVLAQAEWEDEFAVLEAVFPHFADMMLFGMDVDAATLSVKATQGKPTSSPMAYGLYLAAQKAATAKQYERAHAFLDRALAHDPRFAMAHWAKGELFRLNGTTDPEGRDWAAGAREIDPDHPRMPITLQIANPVPTLLRRGAGASVAEIGRGLRSKTIEMADFRTTVRIWSFEREAFALDIGLQEQLRGTTAAVLRESTDAILAVNGGFFEIDIENRLSPSGLLVRDGQRLHGYDRRAGSGLLLVRDGEVQIGWSRDWERYDGVELALQSGPLVVDPGGQNGIYTNDYDRRERSAICLRAGEIVVIAVTGNGLSLFELGQFLSTDREQGGVGCERALNLDGGASTQFAFKAGDVDELHAGVWKIHNAVLLKPASGAVGR